MIATTTLSVACGELLTLPGSPPPPVGNIVPPPPKLCVQTTPEDAVVVLNGQTATAPCTLLSGPLGPVEVEVSAPAHIPHQETVVMSSYSQELTVTLVPDKAVPHPPVGNLVAPPPPASDVTESGCAALQELEVAALSGTLSVEQRGCLEDMLREATIPEQRHRASTALLQDAQVRADQAAWEQLMQRHLQEVNPADPGACFQYAHHRYRMDDNSGAEVLELTDCALEHQQLWAVSDLPERVGRVYALRAKAADRLWKRAVQEGASEEQVRTHRARTETCAMDWLAHAREHGGPTSDALDLCHEAAADATRCQP